MSDFVLSATYPSEPDASVGQDELAYSLGNLRVEIDDVLVSSYEGNNKSQGETLKVPSYNLAEWIAENWWALLYEPKKTDDSMSDDGFRSRHWFGVARDGFVLPDMWIYRSDIDHVLIEATSSSFPLAKMTLPLAATCEVTTEDASGVLRRFVKETLERLTKFGFPETAAHEWIGANANVSEDEERYCRLAGTLGLNPFEDNGAVGKALSMVDGKVPDEVLMDVCEAAKADEFLHSINDVVALRNELPSQPTANLNSFFAVNELHFADLVDRRAPWHRGVTVADRVRATFDIDDTDPLGAQALYDELGLNDVVAGAGSQTNDEPVWNGGISRSGDEVQIALLQKDPRSRRFDAMRSCFLASGMSKSGEKLITRSKVREQQASRAFAAEMLAPISYIRKNATEDVLYDAKLFGMAAALEVSPTVVKYQAINNGMRVI